MCLSLRYLLPTPSLTACVSTDSAMHAMQPSADFCKMDSLLLTWERKSFFQQVNQTPTQALTSIRTNVCWCECRRGKGGVPSGLLVGCYGTWQCALTCILLLYTACLLHAGIFQG